MSEEEKKPRRLNKKQELFVIEYTRDFNATRAAKAAGYSPRTAGSIGSENLTKPEIITAIEARIKEKTMGADEVLLRLADIARGDMADLMDITPAGFTFRLLTEGENGEHNVNPNTKLIKKIKQKVTTFIGKKDDDEDREVIETELELYSAHDALRDIGKYHKLFTEKIEATGADGEPLIKDDSEKYDRSISKLADALGKIVSGSATEPQGNLDATERTSVDGSAIEG